ncbi:hypothetical protein LCGC14_1725290 [marine sediment metagenome]|uniref:Uncharacterized protein n=1 Tax=marine sediment metagenome TaxID=412755 RepID=A0A0F9JRU7_9ZZZZ
MWDSVGEEILIDHDNPLYPIGERKRTLEEIIMVIRAPRGQITLWYRNLMESQCEGIKAFMQEHNA